MDVLHISLKTLEQDLIELRYWREKEAQYEDKQLQISEIEDLITLCQRDYYALRPQLPTIGKKLYRWLDGEGRWLTRAINDRSNTGLVLAIALDAKLTHLPWEVLHDGEAYLVSQSPMITPVRWVEESKDKLTAQTKSLKLLFMATSPINVQPVLEFEREESEILKITQEQPLTLRVEESGCVQELKKLWSRYKQDTFDVFHLTGHANIQSDAPYQPYFITETLTGERAETYPEQLLKVFGERPPRLIFLAGCRTGESRQNGSLPSFAEQLIKKGIPAVLGWGRPVLDTTATESAATLYAHLSAGDSLAYALNQTYQSLLARESIPDWHLLRLYVRGESWGSLVNPPEFYTAPKSTQEKYFLDPLKLSPVATPEDYVGRRRLLQKALRHLRSAQSGVMFHGLGGVGKSSTAARLVERLPEYEPLVFFRGLDGPKLERELSRQCQSEHGTSILESNLPRMQRLSKFLDQGLNDKKQRFLFILDDFEANLDVLSGDRAVLKADVIEVMSDLLEALDRCETPHRLIITSRYDVQFPVCNQTLARFQIKSLKDADLQKKCDRLAGFQTESKRSELQQNAIAIADGNPRLLEWLDKVLQDKALEKERILYRLEESEAQFRENILAEQLLAQQSQPVRTVLTRMQIFELPVPYEAIAASCPELENLSSHCQSATALGLLEGDPEERSNYRLPRIFAPLLEQVEDRAIYNRGAAALYQCWWKNSNASESQALELMRLAAIAENHAIEDEVASGLGGVWYEQGRYRDAIQIYERINQQRQKLLGRGASRCRHQPE